LPSAGVSEGLNMSLVKTCGALPWEGEKVNNLDERVNVYSVFSADQTHVLPGANITIRKWHDSKFKGYIQGIRPAWLDRARRTVAPAGSFRQLCADPAAGARRQWQVHVDDAVACASRQHGRRQHQPDAT